MYSGTLNWHKGLDIAIKAFWKISPHAAKAEFHIYGDGPPKGYLGELIRKLGMRDKIFLKDYLPLYEIANGTEEADISLVPKRNDSFGGEAFSRKILEFMALGVPLIVSETKIDRYYFNDSVVQFFNPGDENDLARCMLLLMRDKDKRDRLVENALKFVEDFSWEKRKHEYLSLVDRLTNSKIRKS